jgi:hypothetical protein
MTPKPKLSIVITEAGMMILAMLVRAKAKEPTVFNSLPLSKVRLVKNLLL